MIETLLRAIRNIRRRIGRESTLCLFVITVVTITAGQAHSDTISALEMRQDCRGVEAATSTRGEITMNVTRYPNALTCYGAFAALAQEFAFIDVKTAA